MDRETVKEILAPCGLCCETCFAHERGEIRKHAESLQEKLGNFGIYAKRFETLVGDPVFETYPGFARMLAYLASGGCKGCRQEQCRLFKTCGVRPCHQEKGIDFCFECEDFPCDHTGFDPHLQTRWTALNQRIREIGVAAYAKEARVRPRYL